MGQRSQIYIKYEKKAPIYGGGGYTLIPDGYNLIARYFGWNYGERMISRARHTMAWLLESCEYYWDIEKKGARIAETNFDMVDVQLTSDIMQEWEEQFPDCDFKDYVFNHHNNNGQLYIEISLDGTLKYAFTHPDAENEILDAKRYMEVDDEEWEITEYITEEGKEKNRANMAWIMENATLMTAEELEAYKNYEFRNKPVVKNEIEKN